MKYWWVNHKQTFRKELGEGYIWSPKKKKGGISNRYYDNLKLTQVGDLIFSFAQGQIKAVGLVSGKTLERPKPDFGAAGLRWDDIGWQVPIEWYILGKTFIPKAMIQEIRPLLPDKYSPLKQNGNGNECYLTEINKNLADFLTEEIEKANSHLAQVLSDFNKKIQEDNEVEKIENKLLAPTHREQLIKARVGQGLFRTRVETEEKYCRLTGITDKRFLIASHIKPWKDSTDEEKLDGHNGLLLSPHVDKLFDKGYISFTDDGSVLCANQEIKELMLKWGLQPDKKVGKFSEKQKKYLEFHRKVLLSDKLNTL